jgi:cysteine desulfurase
MKPIYFDYNATTPLDPAVLDAMLPYLSEHYGNPSSVHSFGQRVRGAVETARGHVAALIGARPPEIIFTSGGTEADNSAIFGLFGDWLNGVAGDGAPGHIITTAIEHPAVLEACAALERRGLAVTYVGGRFAPKRASSARCMPITSWARFSRSPQSAESPLKLERGFTAMRCSRRAKFL